MKRRALEEITINLNKMSLNENSSPSGASVEEPMRKAHPTSSGRLRPTTATDIALETSRKRPSKKKKPSHRQVVSDSEYRAAVKRAIRIDRATEERTPQAMIQGIFFARFLPQKGMAQDSFHIPICAQQESFSWLLYLFLKRMVS